ncbi:MAG: hypothetical protein KatS3mg111_1085 [Pirellulaceae bacterium]|nr:MAG: hypothetical protein KatS3mg111_1085 [Pirellulaceae bacterium]
MEAIVIEGRTTVSISNVATRDTRTMFDTVLNGSSGVAVPRGSIGYQPNRRHAPAAGSGQVLVTAAR